MFVKNCIRNDVFLHKVKCKLSTTFYSKCNVINYLTPMSICYETYQETERLSCYHKEKINV